MNRVIVIGCPGSGKSTFSRTLHQKTGIPLHHLDRIYWNADRTTVEKNVFLERLTRILRTDRWIVDGNYGSTMEMRLRACDAVFFLDYPLETCLEGIRSRRGGERSDLPWKEPEGEEDAAFLDFVRSYNSESRPAVLELMKKYPQKEIHVFHDRGEADAFLDGIAE